MGRVYRYLCLIVLLCSPAWAGPRLDRYLQAPNRVEMLKRIFLDIAAIAHPSYHERELRDWVLDLAVEVELAKIWPRAYSMDRAGNFVLRTPATGRFKGMQLPPVAVQAHLDMVPVVLNARTGDEFTTVEQMLPRLRQGLSFAQTDGWWHTRDNETTAGFDNGLGLAALIRLLIDSRIEHPPLELVFTVQEEVGMEGARNFELPLEALVLLNLDHEEEAAFGVGCMGSARAYLDGNWVAPQERLPAGFRPYEIKLKDLAGGHSSGVIHMKLVNAVSAAADLVGQLAERFPGARFLSVRAGVPRIHNKVPNSFDLVVATDAPLADLRAFSSIVKDDWLSRATDEIASEVKLSVEGVGSVEHGGWDYAALAKSVEAIRRLRSGVIPTDAAASELDQYPHRVRTSSSTGYWTLSSPRSGPATMTIGTMARSFNAGDLTTVGGANLATLIGIWHGSGLEPKIEETRSRPWILKDVDLLRLAAREFPSYQHQFANGGLELSPFSEKFPLMRSIAFGMTIDGAHGRRERVKLDTLDPFLETGDRMLIAIGEAPWFHFSCGPATTGGQPNSVIKP